MSLLLPLVAVLVPILTLPYLLFYFDVTPKVAVLLLGTAIACCSFRANARSLSEFIRTRGGRRLVILFGALAMALVISTAVSSNKALSLSGGNWRRFGLLTQLALLAFVVLAVARISTGRMPLDRTLRGTAATGLLISVYTLLQYFGWDPLLPSGAYHVGEGFWTIVRPPGTIGHANYLGTYLIFVVFLSASLVSSERSRLWKLVGLAAALAGAFAIILSGARSAIVGALAAAVFLVVRMKPRRRTALGAALIFLAALTVFYYSPFGQKLRSRTRWYREDPIGGARLLLWRDSLYMVRERALAGWGPETFATEFPRFQSLELARAYPDFYHESPHNAFLDELTGKGVFGFVPFLAVTALALWACFDRSHRTEPAVAAAFVGGLVSVQFNSLVLATAFFFYLTAALLIAGRADPAPSLPSWRAAIAGISLAVLFATFAVRLCVADFALARVRRLISTGDPFAVAAKYATVLNWQPPGVSSDLYYSRAIAPLGPKQREILPAIKALQESIQAGIRATKGAEDRHNAFYNLASLYALNNNPRDAEHNLRSAIEVAPNWFKPHWMLARVLNLKGQHGEAWKEAQAALERGGSKLAEVVETLRPLKPSP